MTILDRSTRILLSTLPNSTVYHEVEMPPMEGRFTWREPILSAETATKLYDATSFLTWRYGLHFNTHLIITFGMLGLDDCSAAAAMPRFNKEMKRFLGVPDTGRQRRGGRPRSGANHHYVYVFEYGRNRGLHAHMLCVIPPGMKKAVEAHIRQWWAREAGLVPACARCRFPERLVPCPPELKPYTKAARSTCPGLKNVFGCSRHGVDTLGSKMPEEAILVEHKPQSCPTKAHRQQTHWFRYILKTTEPGKGWTDTDGTFRTIEAILGLPLRPAPRPYIGALPRRVAVAQLHGISQSIGAAARRNSGFQSRLRPGQFEGVLVGYEWGSYQTRETMKTLKP